MPGQGEIIHDEGGSATGHELGHVHAGAASTREAAGFGQGEPLVFERDHFETPYFSVGPHTLPLPDAQKIFTQRERPHLYYYRPRHSGDLPTYVGVYRWPKQTKKFRRIHWGEEKDETAQPNVVYIQIDLFPDPKNQDQGCAHVTRCQGDHHGLLYTDRSYQPWLAIVATLPDSHMDAIFNNDCDVHTEESILVAATHKTRLRKFWEDHPKACTFAAAILFGAALAAVAYFVLPAALMGLAAYGISTGLASGIIGGMLALATGVALYLIKGFHTPRQQQQEREKAVLAYIPDSDKFAPQGFDANGPQPGGSTASIDKRLAGAGAMQTDNSDDEGDDEGDADFTGFPPYPQERADSDMDTSRPAPPSSTSHPRGDDGAVSSPFSPR